MADSVNVNNWPKDASKERVAFDLMELILRPGNVPWNENNILDLYTRCLHAAYGSRTIS